jgi:hypothetical protein
MKILILLSAVLFLGACSQDSDSSPKKASTPSPQPGAPVPTSDSGDPFWKSKKVSCSTEYVRMEYYLDTSFRFQTDKMIGILDVHSWDNNAPGSDYKYTFTLKCNLRPDPSTQLSMIVCEQIVGNVVYAQVTLQRNSLDEVRTSVYVAERTTEGDYCRVEKK